MRRSAGMLAQACFHMNMQTHTNTHNLGKWVKRDFVLLRLKTETEHSTVLYSTDFTKLLKTEIFQLKFYEKCLKNCLILNLTEKSLITQITYNTQ